MLQYSQKNVLNRGACPALARITVFIHSAFRIRIGLEVHPPANRPSSSLPCFRLAPLFSDRARTLTDVIFATAQGGGDI